MKGAGSVADNRKTADRNKSFLYNLFRTKPLSAVSLIILAMLLIVAALADVIAPVKIVNGILPTNILDKLQPPSAEHLFGTDSVGRDLFSYMVYGCRTSVLIAIGCTLLSTTLSVFIGVFSAVLGGWFDLIVQRIVDAWMCIPSLLITMILMAMFGNGIPQMILVLSIPMGIGGSRMIRSTAIAVKDMDYMKTSKMLGGGKVWVVFKHVIPNIMPLVLMSMAGSVGGVIMSAASLSFLGYGVSVNTPDWGAMLTSAGRSYMYLAPWLAIIPGLAIMLVVFAASMFSDGVRDLLDPRLRGGVGTYKSGTKKDKKQTGTAGGGEISQ